MILSSISLPSDLSEAALEEALSKIYGDKDRRELYVSTHEIALGRKLANKYRLKLFVDTDLWKQHWYVMDNYFGIFSDGP